MDHSEIKDKIYQLIDGELPQNERLSAEAHLKSCSECADLAKEWKTISQALFKPASVPSTDFFVTKVMAKIDELGAPRPSLLEKFWKIPALALALMAFFLIFSAPEDTALPSVPNILSANSDNTFLASNNLEIELDDLLEISEEAI